MKVELTNSNFEAEALDSEIPVMVHFTSEIGYDKKLETVIGELYPDYLSKFKFGSLNISQNISTARKYGVFMTPALLFFKNRRVVAQLMNVAIPKEEIIAKLNIVHEKSLEELQELGLIEPKVVPNCWVSRHRGQILN